MNLDDMLKEHQLWLDKAHQSLTAVKARNDAPADLRQPRIESLKARIAELTEQKEREVKRFDVAIAELNGELAGLTAKTSPDPGTSSPSAAATKKRPKRAAKAKAKK